MKVESIKLADLSPHPENPRNHSDLQIAEMCKSLELFGQFRAIVIDEKNTILAGHSIWMSAKKLGWDKVDVYMKTGLTERQKIKLLLADNKLAELGSDNYDKVLDLLKGFDGDFDIPGFDPQALDDLLSSVNQALDDYGKTEPPANAKEQEPFFGQGPTEPRQTAEPENQSQTPPPRGYGRKVICPDCGMEFEI